MDVTYNAMEKQILDFLYERDLLHIRQRLDEWTWHALVQSWVRWYNNGGELEP